MPQDQGLADTLEVLNLAAHLLQLGYYAVPTGIGGDGKTWLGAKDRSLPLPYKPLPDGSSPEIEQVLQAFRDNPGCGISVATPHLRAPYHDDLLAIDIDIIKSKELIEAIASIIRTPCPVRVGSKGCVFFVRYPAMESIPNLLRKRDLPIPKWAKVSGIQVPAYANEEHNGIDLMGLKHAHVIIPPTLHLTASQRAKTAIHYRWVEFPGTATILTLEDTPPRDLPEIDVHQLLLIYQYCKNPKSALFNYLGQTTGGNHHGLMLSATTYMWHEKFTQDEIETICTDEAIRSAPSDDKAEARIKEIKTAVHTLAARMPDQKPARFPGSRPPGSAKVPKDRTMADSLVNDMGRDNLAYFTGVAHHWNGHQWVRIAQLDNPAGPLAQIYNSLMQENPEANHSLIKSAMAMFSNCIEMREAAPDHSSIPFKNGLLDVHSRRLRPITRDEYIIQHIPFDYDPGADCPLWRAFMRHLFEPPLEFEYETPKARFEDWDRAINAAEEFFGYCLTRSHAMQKMLYVIGKPDTGKSVLFKVLRGLLPKQWVSTVSLETFDDPNSLVQMVGSYINIASEVGRRSRDVDDVLLRVTAGEDVTVKLLFQNKFQAILPTRLIFQGNLPPDTTDGTGAIQRRILMLRTTDSPPNKKIEDYDRIILKEAKGILNRLVAAYARLLERGQFESPNYSKQLVEDMKTESNSALYWAKEVCRDPNPGEENTQNEELFDHYIEYCTRLNLYKMSSIMWGKQLTAAGWPTVRKRGAGGNVIRTRALVFKSTMVRGNSY